MSKEKGTKAEENIKIIELYELAELRWKLALLKYSIQKWKYQKE